MHIGEVAEATGLTQRTIRYYEERGLLPTPERTLGDFRLYTGQDVRRLTEIARYKELLGFSLAEIKVIIEADEARLQLKSEFSAAGDATTRLQKLRQFEGLAAGQLAIVARKLGQMADMKSELEARLARYQERIIEIELQESSGSRP
jgi:MerR family transcriptional regulator, repressor of the yfmOP operon